MSQSSGPQTHGPHADPALHPLLKAEAASRLRRQINSVAWGLVFLWIGAVWFSGLSWYWGMIGIGAIFLGEALVEGIKDLGVSGMSVMFGMLFLSGGIWGIASAPFALLPVLFVLFGVAMVWRAAASLFRRN